MNTGSESMKPLAPTLTWSEVNVDLVLPTEGAATSRLVGTPGCDPADMLEA